MSAPTPTTTTATTPLITWRKSRRSGSHPDGNCVEIARVPRPAPSGCHCCGGDGQMGSSQCPVCTGSGHCGCH
jgi:uncharacterized protein DUF397